MGADQDLPGAEAWAQLRAEVAELRALRAEDRAMTDDLLAYLRRSGLGDAPAEEAVYGSWPDWVDEWLVPRVSRSPHRYRWCHRYAEHPEVADRLEALWHAWEVQWPDPLARLPWFRDGLDHQWPQITGEDGPLRDCSAREGVHVAQALAAAGSTVGQGRRS